MAVRLCDPYEAKEDGSSWLFFLPIISDEDNDEKPTKFVE